MNYKVGRLSAWLDVCFLGGRWRVPLLALLLVVFGFSARAQWLTETNIIPPGWSAVNFYVDGSYQGLDQLISQDPSNPIDQVWLWQTPSSTAQYITTPQTPLNAGGQWLTWTRSPTNMANTLSALIGNAACLVHSTASANYTWRVQGRPVPPSYSWDMTGMNFIGFPTPSVNPPSFQNYLAPDPAISSIAQVWQYTSGPLNAATNPKFVFAMAGTPVTRGEAFWVSATNVYNAYFGPFQVNLPNPSGIGYGASGGQITFHLNNYTTNILNVSVRLLPSETQPAGQTNIVAAPPLLVEGALNPTNLTYAYTALTVGAANSYTWTLAPSGQSGSDVAVVLGVNRFAMTTGPAGSTYAGILQFTDSLGFSEVDVPVSAQSASTVGLWVGSASITQVASYLKTYATNADGSYQQTPATNFMSVTNLAGPPTLGNNLSITSVAATNVTITTCTTNVEVVNTCTPYALSYTTNATVLSTNSIITFSCLTNLTIVTTATNYIFTNGNFIWLTTETNNTTFTNSAMVTNQVVVLTSLTPVSNFTNGAPVAVTNFTIYEDTATNIVITNGVFEGPVTNIFPGFTSTTNSFVVGTNPCAVIINTNLTAGTNNVIANILWGRAANIVGNGDVATNGTAVYAYAWSGVSTNVNSVAFAGTTTNIAGPGNVQVFLASGTNAPSENSWVFESPDPPFSDLSVNYQHLLLGGLFGVDATGMSVVLGNLVPGHLYSVQVWAEDPRGAPTPRTENVVGANAVTLAFCTNQAPGFLGQYTIGTFVATNSSQSFTLIQNSAGGEQLNALQVRDITPANVIASTTVTQTNFSVSTSIYPAAPMAVFTNVVGGITDYITVNLQTNIYVVTNLTTTYTTPTTEIISNNYAFIDGIISLAGATTNLVAGVTTNDSSGTGCSTATVSALVATNPAVQVATMVAVAGTSYIVATLNTNTGPVVTPYPLRLILFNDGTRCSLLQRVFFGVQKGGSNQVVALSEGDLDTTQLASARRISTTTLPWNAVNTSWLFSGSLLPGGTLSTTVYEAYDDQASNPFLHTYHPDHNNLSFNGNGGPPTELPPGSESYGISQQITLVPGTNGDDFGSLTTVGTSLSGTYSEAITFTGNNSSRTFNTSGAFTLTQISTVSTLIQP